MASHNLSSATSLYDRFLPGERLSLLLEAMARGDAAETDRLLRSCPRKTYTQPDAAFDDRFSMAFDVTAVVCGDLQSLTGQLSALQWASEVVQDLAAIHHVNEGLPELDEALADPVRAVSEKAERTTQLILRVLSRGREELAVQLAGVWDAFGDFCRGRVGMAPGRVLDACAATVRGEVEEALKTYPTIKADAQETAKYRDALCRVWDQRFGEER